MVAPSHLYKYQRLSAHSLASLLNETVWLASPTSFNDPFDCAITLSKDKLQESLDHAIVEISRNRGIPKEVIEKHDHLTKNNAEAYELLRTTLKTNMGKIGVFCLSETSEEILMWSHYADNHKGFCIEYDCGADASLRKIATPVTYSESYPALSLANMPASSDNSFLNVCLFTKAKQWAYEREWRVVMSDGNRVFQAPSQVTSIILGSRMPTEDKVMLYKALRHKEGIQFKEAQLCDDRFAIEFHDFSL